MASIYGLYDAQGQLRYIGKANDPVARLRSHMREIGRRRTPLYDWLKKHGSPEMRVLEAGCDDWREAERRLIAEARLRGERLLNVADGGDEPFCSTEQRRKNARKVIAMGHGFTREQASRHAIALNARLRADPEARRLREIKRYLSSHIAEHGFTPEGLGKLFYASRRAPSLFGSWFERLANKHLKPLSDDEYRRFVSTVDGLCG